MGSYSAPTQIFIDDKEIVDSSTPPNAILFEGNLVDYFVFIRQSPLYDGAVDAQFQHADGTWETIIYVAAAGQTILLIPGSFPSDNTIADSLYPFRARVIVTTACTVGSATVYIRGRRGPTNPLF